MAASAAVLGVEVCCRDRFGLRALVAEPLADSGALLFGVGGASLVHCNGGATRLYWPARIPASYRIPDALVFLGWYEPLGYVLEATTFAPRALLGDQALVRT